MAIPSSLGEILSYVFKLNQLGTLVVYNGIVPSEKVLLTLE